MSPLFEYLFEVEGSFLFFVRMPILVFLQVTIMTRYLKGFKVDTLTGKRLQNIVGPGQK